MLVKFSWISPQKHIDIKNTIPGSKPIQKFIINLKFVKCVRANGLSVISRWSSLPIRNLHKCDCKSVLLDDQHTGKCSWVHGKECQTTFMIISKLIGGWFNQEKMGLVLLKNIYLIGKLFSTKVYSSLFDVFPPLVKDFNNCTALTWSPWI